MKKTNTRIVFAVLLTVASAACANAQVLYGIDVSHYQGTIDWTSAHNAGATFAFAKATEGVDFVDSNFAQNMIGAKAAGVIIGPYHFARPDSSNTDPNDAANEANDFVDAILPYYQGPNLTLRPVIDLERLAGVGNASQEKVFLSRWIRNFAAVVHNRLGFDPMIYTSSTLANNYLEVDIAQYPLWLAYWNNLSSLPPTSASGIWNGQWTFWQATSTATVPGISGNVDGDVFVGEMSDLVKYAPGVPEPSTLVFSAMGAVGLWTNLARRRRS
jgi:GH25 family lysozyme M1 (1,4-beta-N-acetylmuramidase)